MSHCRLIYRSTSTDKVIANEDLKALLEKAAEHNRTAGIAGLLVLSGNRFLQALEGPAEAVNQLFCRIVRDPRHTDIELLTFEQIGPTYFDDWNMYLVDLFDLPKGPRDYLARKYRCTKDGAVIVPERLHEVYALLLDARSICLSRPWEGPDRT